MAKPIILCDTKGMSEEQWLKCREHGPKGDIPYTVGGSDVATIFGLSPWMTPLELWLVKKGKMRNPEKPNPLQLEMGHFLEPIAAHFFANKTGYAVIDDTYMYRHADFPYMLADFDRRYLRKTDNEEGILECKSCSYYKTDVWKEGGYPEYYEMQLRYYLGVSDLNHGAFSCIWGNNPETDLATPEIVRDKTKEDLIYEKLDRWIWSLEHDVPPTMDEVKSSELALKALGRIYGDSKKGLPTVEFSKIYEMTLRRIATLQKTKDDYNAEMKKLDEEAEKLSVKIAEIMKQHEHGVLETTTDKILIDYVTRKSVRTDTAKLKEKYKTVYDEVIKTTESRKMKVRIEEKKIS